MGQAEIKYYRPVRISLTFPVLQCSPEHRNAKHEVVKSIIQMLLAVVLIIGHKINGENYYVQSNSKNYSPSVVPSPLL